MNNVQQVFKRRTSIPVKGGVPTPFALIADVERQLARHAEKPFKPVTLDQPCPHEPFDVVMPQPKPYTPIQIKLVDTLQPRPAPELKRKPATKPAPKPGSSHKSKPKMRLAPRVVTQPITHTWKMRETLDFIKDRSLSHPIRAKKGDTKTVFLFNNQGNAWALIETLGDKQHPVEMYCNGKLLDTDTVNALLSQPLTISYTLSELPYTNGDVAAVSKDQIHTIDDYEKFHMMMSLLENTVDPMAVKTYDDATSINTPTTNYVFNWRKEGLVIEPREGFYGQLKSVRSLLSSKAHLDLRNVPINAIPIDAYDFPEHLLIPAKMPKPEFVDPLTQSQVAVSDSLTLESLGLAPLLNTEAMAVFANVNNINPSKESLKSLLKLINAWAPNITSAKERIAKKELISVLRPIAKMHRLSKDVEKRMQHLKKLNRYSGRLQLATCGFGAVSALLLFTPFFWIALGSAGCSGLSFLGWCGTKVKAAFKGLRLAPRQKALQKLDEELQEKLSKLKLQTAPL